MSLFFAFMSVVLSVSAQTESTFQVKGVFKKLGFPVQKVYLSYRAGDKNVTDSVEPKGGVYVFSGKLAEPVLGFLRVKYLPEADGKPVKMAIPLSKVRGQMRILPNWKLPSKR